jgi:spermidine/putrescine transport system ATP-binding protein
VNIITVPAFAGTGFATDLSLRKRQKMGLRTYAVCKNYGDTRALYDIDIAVAKGEFFTLLGPSGCGKTTLLRIIAGLEMVDNGRVVINGRDFTSVPANRRPVNTVFQSYAMFPHMTVLENVCFGPISRKVPKATAIEKAKKTLDLVKMTQFESRKPDQLSGGQRQRVALARALVNEPELLLLDEPMSALDAKLRVQVQVELRQIQQRLEKTFIMVTHDQTEALTVSDRMAVMDVGEIAQFGSVREVYDRPVTRFVADFLQVENFIKAEKVGDREVTTPLGRLLLDESVPWLSGELGIRPEKLQLTSDASKANFSTNVMACVYKGCYQRLILDNSIVMEIEASSGIKSGDRINVCIPRESLIVLREKSFQRMKNGEPETVKTHSTNQNP